MKALILRSRWLMLLPLAAGVAFLVHLNIVNRVSDFLDERGLEVILQKQILHIISNEPADKNAKSGSKPLKAREETPGIVSTMDTGSKGLHGLILRIEA